MQPQNGYKTLQIVFFALLAGQLVFLTVAFFIIQQKIFTSAQHDLENIFLPLLVILALVCMISGSKIFKTKIQKLGETRDLSIRFFEYRAS